MAWLSDWKKRIKITIDHNKVDEDLSDFPLMVTLASGTGILDQDVTSVFDELTTVTSGTIDSYTKLLLHTEGDLSPSERTITSNGTPAIHYYSPFDDYGSFYLNGSSAYFTIDDSTDWLLTSSSSWTIDFWMYKNGSQPDWTNVISRTDNSPGGWIIGFKGSNDKFGIHTAYNGTGGVTSSQDIDGTEWHHYAIVHDNSADKLYLFIDGVVDDEQTASTAINWTNAGSSQPLYIGYQQYVGGRNFNGYLYGVRVSTGIARWTSTFSGSLPGSDYESDSYTKLLLCPEGNKTTSDHSLTFYGDTKIYPTGKFSNYGSYYFNGGDYIYIPNSSDWDVGSGDFTIDCWFNVPNVTGNKALWHTTADHVLGFFLGGNRMNYFASSTGNSWNLICGDAAPNNGRGSIDITANVWHHVAFVRSGNDWYGFIDGKQDLYVNVPDSPSVIVKNIPRVIGAWIVSYYQMTGQIAEFRFSKGIARWASDFTPSRTVYPNDTYVNNSKKIAITQVDGITQQYVEIEDWDAEIQKANLWTKCPVVSSGVDTDLYLYYDITKDDNYSYVGNTAEDVAKNVWNSDYMSVYHMAQVPVGSSSIYDSTSNNIHLTPTGGMAPLNSINGEFTKAITFDGSNDRLNSATLNFSTLQTVFTIEAKVKWLAYNSNWQHVMQLGPNSVGSPGIAKYSSSTNYAVSVYGDDVEALDTPMDLGTWHILAYRLTSGVLNLFKNNVKSAYTNSVTVGNLSSTSLYIAANASSAEPGRFDLEEFRISKSSLSDSWIKSSYYSMSNDLMIFGDEEYIPTHYYYGYITESLVPVSRRVLLYNRDTGILMGETTSSGTNGYYYVTTTISGEHFIVVLDDDGGESYNALISDKLLPRGIE